GDGFALDGKSDIGLVIISDMKGSLERAPDGTNLAQKTLVAVAPARYVSRRTLATRLTPSADSLISARLWPRPASMAAMIAPSTNGALLIKQRRWRSSSSRSTAVSALKTALPKSTKIKTPWGDGLVLMASTIASASVPRWIWPWPSWTPPTAATVSSGGPIWRTNSASPSASWRL